ncbi:signal peptidase I [Kineococcus rhizosphaerae]|uniref:(S)-ureidoglycine aminohydrolase cupin domain-containing protein n=1 Tax=Kineococcus rhizosphaerae TaxID=559628 RepID=A0A2T0R2I1_9ACTN|nr:signal peptidase I [Kineococcus rhizosphaerae]PRY13994.1 hypothetical protein CLV37_107113 [Kineococcus rhizosphaerae]
MSWYAGNADVDGAQDGGWFFGSFMAGRAPARTSEHLEVKWAQLDPGSRDEEWTAPEAETSLCVLVAGSQRLRFREGDVLLSTPGDYVVWFPGEQHTWESSPTEVTTTITVRWPSRAGG